MTRQKLGLDLPGHLRKGKLAMQQRALQRPQLTRQTKQATPLLRSLGIGIDRIH